MAKFLTKRCPRRILPSSGLLFRYQVSHWKLVPFSLLCPFPGQGPYFGQATWFARFHPEKIPFAVDRYVNEIFRVTGVLDKAIEANEKRWLVGDKMTYADLSFITWATVGEGLVKELGKLEEFEKKFPSYTQWMKKMEELGAVKRIRDQMARGRAEHGLK
jgi:glutathione S-transferase